MLNCSSIIGGEEIFKRTYSVESSFYPGASHLVADASLLDVATAIGSARRAERSHPQQRAEYLEKAAGAFQFTLEHVEHIVRLSGLPIRQVQSLLDEIPYWLRSAPRLLASRFSIGQGGYFCELYDSGVRKLLLPPPGFCYAVTPGNDPRSSALVAAVLGTLGIPFVLKASSRDVMAPMVIRALIDGGFDPSFCNLVYFQGESSQHPGSAVEARQKHFRLVDACDCVWTFGPDAAVDRLLRYEPRPPQAVIDLAGLAWEDLDTPAMRRLLGERPFQIDRPHRDHLTGKIVLRHNSGNCATIAGGDFTAAVQSILFRALAFPQGCTATKSLMLIGAGDWVPKLAEWIAGLKVGDPLDPETQIGFLDPRVLDYLQETVHKNRFRADFYGGKRLSPHQAAPLLVYSQEELAEFLAEEIPAYVLTVRECESVEHAVALINRYTRAEPRLAVSCVGLSPEDTQVVAQDVRTHAILIDEPTTRITPVFHEGNDYVLRLMRGRLIIRHLD